MNKLFHFFIAALAIFSMTACMDDYDDPNTDGFLVTSPTSIGEVNYSIAQLKQDNMALFKERNKHELFENDSIIEGVVAANDCGGNLYQTLLIRHIDTTKTENDPLRDQAIVLAVKHTWLTPYFPLGQRVKINLKGLYIGTYSKLPKIGQPYFTSSGNLRLGPILLQLCSTNVELVGKPDPNCAECQPIVRTPEWLRASANKTPLNYPQLVTVTGSLQEMSGDAANKADVASGNNMLYPGSVEPLPKIFAPKELSDKGYGVDRTIVNDVNNTKVTLRTSTQNDIAYTELPAGEKEFTGMLSIYNEWQIQLRSLDDIKNK